MSWVTHAVLTWDSSPDEEADVFADTSAQNAEVLAQVNEFFKDEDGEEIQKGFVSLKDPTLPRGWHGGSQSLECEMAVGAFNYLDVSGLVDHLRNLDWEASESVQLFIKDQQDDRFRLINVFEE
jgi:hypothetical protein